VQLVLHQALPELLLLLLLLQWCCQLQASPWLSLTNQICVLIWFACNWYNGGATAAIRLYTTSISLLPSTLLVGAAMSLVCINCTNTDKMAYSALHRPWHAPS
jgi:hypothetical protein